MIIPRVRVLGDVKSLAVVPTMNLRKLNQNDNQKIIYHNHQLKYLFIDINLSSNEDYEQWVRERPQMYEAVGTQQSALMIDPSGNQNKVNRR